MLTVVPLFSSSAGNSFYIKHKKEEILIDAGVSLKMLKTALCSLDTDIANISRIFITHEHIDHIKALETIAKNFSIPIIINSASANAIDENKFPTALKHFFFADHQSEVFTDGMKISVFKTPHDSMGSVGYHIETDDDDSLGYATDIGMVTKGVAKNLMGCRTVVIESNHDLEMLRCGHYPYYTKARIMSDTGHLSNEACAKFLPVLVQSGTQNIILAHLSVQNNTPKKAYICALNSLEQNGISYKDISLKVAQGEI